MTARLLRTTRSPLEARSFFEGIPDCYATFTEYTLAWKAIAWRSGIGSPAVAAPRGSAGLPEADPGALVLNPATGEVRQALKCDDRCLVESITWSPDGSRLAFEMRNQIWVVPVDGKGAFLASTGVGISAHPVWSPDGSPCCLPRTPSSTTPGSWRSMGKAKASCTSSLNWMDG